MHIWLMTIGEPLPTDDRGDRLLRTGLVANLLADHGHEVLWWTSAFDRVRRELRTEGHRLVEYRPNCRLQLLDGPGYRRNVSLARIRHHQATAAGFEALCERAPRPDVILCSLPTLELSVAAVRYGRTHGVPVVLDVRDMWPDAIVDLAPAGTRLLARRLLASMFAEVREACRGATALFGITEEYVDWALGYAGRSRGPLDAAFPLAYSSRPVEPAALAAARNFWREQGLTGKPGQFVGCFFGTLGRHFETGTVIEAARLLEKRGVDVRFVLCGAGPGLRECQRRAAGCRNVLVPGWVDSAQIQALMQLSSCGLAPYRSTRDFVISIPNKAIEYLAGGLPVLSSLQGVLAKLLDENECGRTWKNGDANGLAEIVAQWGRQPEQLARMSANAARLFRERFVAEVVYGELEKKLVEIAAAGSAGDWRSRSAA